MAIEITGETIKNAIARQLGTCFSSVVPRPAIYKEKMVQNLDRPSFFIWTMDVSQTKLMNQNFTRHYQMNVRYRTTSSSQTTYEELCSVANAVLECLSTIYLARGIRQELQYPVVGKQMSFQITEGVLQVFVSYDVNTKTSSPPVPEMGQLEINNEHVRIPEPIVAGEYVVGTVYSLADRIITVGGNRIPAENLHYGLLVNESAVWEAVRAGDEVILLRNADSYYVLDSSTTRLKDSVDGGTF